MEKCYFGSLFTVIPANTLWDEWHEVKPNTTVFPAHTLWGIKAGIQNHHWSVTHWIPACAGIMDGVGFLAYLRAIPLWGIKKLI
ncbi:MAG: hypothetical protein COB30_006790 [Ectothiorhodospiraceae bacterium]|nr:hypothetical protein [Ectothiorhodospiraceae bacterium]